MATIANWKLNGNANDAANGYNGSVSGTVTYGNGGPNGLGYAIFAGAGRIDATAADPNNPFSYGCTFRTSQAGSQGSLVLCYTTNSSSSGNSWIAVNRDNGGSTVNGALNVHSAASGSSDAYNAASANDGAWHRAWYSRDSGGTADILFFDGKPVTLTGSLSTGDNTGNKFSIGRLENNAIPFSGDVQNVMVMTGQSLAFLKNDWAYMKGLFC